MHRLLPLLALLLAACSAGPVPEYRLMRLSDFEVPASARKGQPVTIKLTMRSLDACWAPSSAAAQVDEATRSVTLLATERRVAADPCPQAISYPTLEARFTPASTGTYTVKAAVLAGERTNETRELARALTVTE